MSKSVSLVVTLLALIAFGSLASAQSATCNTSYTFTAGSGNFNMSFCLTDNGNIVQYATPTTSEHLSSQSEGYGICDTNPLNGKNVNYYDYAGGGAANWGAVTSVVQLGGAGTLPLTITRLTADGVWQLAQTFTQSVPDRAIKIKMDFTNLSGVDRSINILRFANIDANALTDNDFEATLYSSFAANQNLGGIQLRDWANVADVPMVFSVPDGPKPCSLSPSTVQFSGDGAIGLQYNRTVKAGATKTVKVLYRPI